MNFNPYTQCITVRPTHTHTETPSGTFKLHYSNCTASSSCVSKAFCTMDVCEEVHIKVQLHSTQCNPSTVAFSSHFHPKQWQWIQMGIKEQVGVREGGRRLALGAADIRGSNPGSFGWGFTQTPEPLPHYPGPLTHTHNHWLITSYLLYRRHSHSEVLHFSLTLWIFCFIFHRWWPDRP